MKKKVLDITLEKCPITFLKAKMFLKEHDRVSEKIILIKGKKNLLSLKETLKKNFKVTSKKIHDEIYEIVVK
ncbi:MAG: hypothetical protein CFH30_01158 [Alphaproteobacteria bacterium MarineAlpha8_Bin1]|nr:MAG: hypothetical protein CFH30_01158 [Alphaproteobacteria bacterium MarineAlpha8_Bin1]|tara:strand:+ start:72 stop:287 length:216 start_codon:yes stop_codon:yes gene_type:complete